MKPEFQLLGISIKTFGVAFALGFLAGGVVGARAYYLIEKAGSLPGSLLGNIFSGSGLVWYGGAIGGAIGVIGWMRWRHVLGLRVVDMCGKALPRRLAVRGL